MDNIKINLKRPIGWRGRASSVEEWDAWDRACHKKLRWWAGLKVWSKTSAKGSRVLISRHWPHLLCWSWSVWVGPTRSKRFAVLADRQHRTIRLTLWAVYIQLSWQDYGYIGALGPCGKAAPQIYWKHHLEEAAPVGRA